MKKEYKIPTTLMQYYTVVEEHEKLSFLLSYAISHKGEKSIVFVSTCHEVEFFAFILERCEFLDEEKRIVKSEIFKLHGNIM